MTIQKFCSSSLTYPLYAKTSNRYAGFTSKSSYRKWLRSNPLTNCWRDVASKHNIAYKVKYSETFTTNNFFHFSFLFVSENWVIIFVLSWMYIVMCADLISFGGDWLSVCVSAKPQFFFVPKYVIVKLTKKKKI